MNAQILRQIQKVRAEHGTRPFFLYDLDCFQKHLTSLISEGVKLWYATKANPLSVILQIAQQSGLGIDCASGGEVRQARRAGAKEILLTGPCKSKNQISEALAQGVHTFVLESPRQLQHLNELAKDFSVTALLRMQISWTEGEKSVLGGKAVTPFGCDLETWSQMKLRDFPQVKVLGLHCFQWGNVLDANRLGEVWGKTAVAAQELSRVLKFDLQVLDLGGGLGIPYQGEAPLEWSAVSAELQHLRKIIPGTELWMELGRYAIGAFGYYATTVVDRKKTFSKNILVLEGGVHHLLRPAIVGEAFPAQVLRASTAPHSSFQVHGPLCTALDKLGEFALPADIDVGDTLVFSQCGAYGFTESMPFFLCHDLPAEFVWHKEEVRCLRNWQTAESWMV